MIGLPGYLGDVQQPGMDIHGPYASAATLQQEQNYDPKRDLALKKEAERSQRAYELTSIAQTLEHQRIRLLVLDLHDGAACLDQVIRDLVLRWDMERHPDAV